MLRWIYTQTSRAFSRPHPIAETALLLLVVSIGFAVRMLWLDALPMWVDEAESSINGLTILQNGYPADEYLGLPIFETTLVRRWPESAEYEFRDLSYSDNHLAIYHGWLPLYMIAGSFALHGIQPDVVDGSLTVKHDLNERKRRTRAARLPGVICGSVFLLILFAGGKRLYGRDAAWAAVIVGAIFPWHLYLSRQARYYSAEVALTTACCILLWLLLTECKWKHVYLSALANVLLFHTHLLSFGVAGLIGTAIAPWIISRREFGMRKIAVWATLVASGTVPWLLATGFFRLREHIPRAWPLLQFPADLWQYPPLKLVYAVPGALVVFLVAWLSLSKSRGPSRLREPMVRLAPVLLFLSAWCAAGYVLFVGSIPAASFAASRLNLVYWGPMFLLSAIVCAALARVIAPRRSLFVSPALMLLVFFATGHTLNLTAGYADRAWERDAIIFESLDALRLDRAARLYAAPNEHLILTFYSGLPVQSMAPVRKSFLDSYPGDIVYIDTSISVNTGALTPERIRHEALRHGQNLSPEAAAQWSFLLRTRDYRETIRKIVDPDRTVQAEPLPAFTDELLNEDRRRRWAAFSNSGLEIMLRGYDVRTWLECREVFEYRFAPPAAHDRSPANYAARLRGVEGILLSTETALYRSSWRPPGAAGGIHFKCQSPAKDDVRCPAALD